VEHGVEHQLHAAGARADHQVDARYRLREALPRVDADALDRQQQRHRQGDGDECQAQGQAPAPGRERGKAQHGFHSAAPAAQLMSCERDAAIEMPGQALVMADEDQRGADGGGLLQQQVDEDLLAFGVERRGRLVGDQDFRAADQRARRGDALLLADREFAGRLRCQVSGARSRWRSRRSASARGVGAGAIPPPRRKGAGQQHVVERRQPGQQVELLEQEADVVGAKAVAGAAAELRDVGAEQFDRALLRQGDAAEQAEQGALAAAAGAVEEDALAGGEFEARNLEAVPRLSRPAKDQVGDSQRGHAGAYQASTGFFGVSRAAPWPPGPARWLRGGRGA
jgi:hypothetical protein